MALAEKEFYNMTVSIQKALNPTEAALKVKHARASIIATFHMKGAQTFWSIVLRQPLMENRFTAWKFCHLLHKILREGHPLCIQHSQRHRKMIIELGKLWGHLTDGLGVCIKNYTKVLITKLEFHQINPRFPGNLSLSREEFEAIGSNDINYYFQLGVEMFDYLDDILILQDSIFDTVNTFRMTSMTEAGQCRLAPVIPLIQDSNPLYDYLVRLMFKLHSTLPNDVLSGHRERFRTIFVKLKEFYERVKPLQYFQGLITVPKLPDTAPNFSSKIDFGSYVAPVVIVPEPEIETETVVDNLVDMSVPNSSSLQQNNQQEDSVNFEKILHDRDDLIRELQTEIDRLGKCMKSLTISSRDQLNERDEQISNLNQHLNEVQQEMTKLKIERDELEIKIQSVISLEGKESIEEKAKAAEEKFQKLKSMYTQIRDEHVKLLRQHGDMSKQMALLKKEKSDLSTEIELLKVQLDEFKEKQSEAEKDLQEKSKAVEKEKELLEKLEQVETKFELLKVKYDNLQADKSAQIADLRIRIEELGAVQESYEKLTYKYNDLENNWKNSNQESFTLKEKLQKTEQELEIYQKRSKESEELILKAQNDLQNASENCRKIENVYQKEIQSKDEEIKNLETLIKDNESKYHMEIENHLLTVSNLDESLKDCRNQGERNISSLLEACIKSSEKLAVRAMNENEFTHAVGTSSYFMMISEELQELMNELRKVYEDYTAKRESVENFAQKLILAGHLLAIVQIQGVTICNSAADIEQSEKIVEEIKHFSQNIVNFFETLLRFPSTTDISTKINQVKEKLVEITNMIHDLSKNSENFGQIGDLVETELASMDKAIEEAAAKIVELLSNSRASDSGIKLEVNEKILDACTNLMKCIQILVKKSRLLQAEIVSLGKGTASLKEFYKRNHQWTEGLISAAKSVAQGANLLVKAANKAVSGEARHHYDLVVAAQEIAACTAQLVVASRVKAPKESKNLQALSAASKDVTQATGVVVATAKNSSQQLEESQDLDLTQLTVHQAKTMEMEIQVKVLELEQALQVERLKLAAFRRKNYQND